MPLTPGQPKEVKEVQVFRETTDNLAVTDVAVSPDSSRIVEGDSVQLHASVTTTDPAASPSVFWASLDTLVAVVSDSGLVRGRLPGTARIVAFASMEPSEELELAAVPAPQPGAAAGVRRWAVEHGGAAVAAGEDRAPFLREEAPLRPERPWALPRRGLGAPR